MRNKTIYLSLLSSCVLLFPLPNLKGAIASKTNLIAQSCPEEELHSGEKPQKSQGE